MPFTARFLLQCDHLNSQFTLTQEGQEWRHSFETFEEAYEHAESRAIGRTPLILCNERGKLILKTAISPLSTELSSARRHWRKLAFAD
jgi:hypothetical protein